MFTDWKTILPDATPCGPASTPSALVTEVEKVILNSRGNKHKSAHGTKTSDKEKWEDTHVLGPLPTGGTALLPHPQPVLRTIQVTTGGLR